MRSTLLLVVVLLAALSPPALADHAADAKRHFARAKAFHGRGEYANALNELKAAYDAQPATSLLYGIAQTYVKLGNCPDATTYYQKFIDAKPSQEAIDHANAAIDACKTSPPPLTAKEHFARATAFHKQGDYAAALNELNSAYETEPTPTLMYAIAQTHVKLGQCAEAITFYERFIETKPKQEAIERAQAAIDTCKSSIETKQEQSKPVESKPVERKPVESKPVERKPVESKPVERKPVERKPVAAKPLIPRPSDVSFDMVRLDMEDRYDRHPVRRWAYVGAGLGVGAMLVASAFGAAGEAAQKSFNDAGCGDRNQVLRAAALTKCVEYERRGSRDVRIGNGLLIGGGSVLALFAAVIILDPGNIERPTIERPRIGRMSVGVSPSSVSLSVPW